MKIKKILMLFAVLMLSVVSVFAQGDVSGDVYHDGKQGVYYNIYRKYVVGFTNTGPSVITIGDPHDSHLGGWEWIIDVNAFKDCSRLTEVTMSELVIAIGENAFRNCTNLTKVSIPTTVTTIGDKAFYDCSSLTELTIPEGVTTIGQRTFYGCKNLTKVTIPESVTSIGEKAFEGTKCFSGITHKATNNSVTVSDIPDQTYTGSKIKPEITVLDESTKRALTLRTDFTIRYIGNIESGNATVIITGIGDYEGMEIKSFDIKSKALVASNISDIPAQSFTGSPLKPSVTVKDGNKVLELKTDYTVSYTNNTNIGTATATISGKGNYSGKVEKTFTIAQKVTESGALTLIENQNGITATIDGNSSSSISLAEDIDVASVTYTRNFEYDGNAYTIMLPFSFKTESFAEGTFHTLESVTSDSKNPSIGIANMSAAITEVEANTPYIFMPSEEIGKITEMTFTNVTLIKTTDAPLTNSCTATNWQLHGVYSTKTWNDNNLNEYGFAATTDGGISAGEFVHFVSGASLKPTRCYLEYSKEGFSKSSPVLPERIIVVFPETSSVIEPNDPENNGGDVITPVSEIAPNGGTKVWSADKTIVIESKAGDQYRIIDLNGRTLRESRLASDREEVTLSHATGIVVVIINGKTFKVNY